MPDISAANILMMPNDQPMGESWYVDFFETRLTEDLPAIYFPNARNPEEAAHQQKYIALRDVMVTIINTTLKQLGTSAANAIIAFNNQFPHLTSQFKENLYDWNLTSHLALYFDNVEAWKLAVEDIYQDYVSQEEKEQAIADEKELFEELNIIGFSAKFIDLLITDCAEVKQRVLEDNPA